MSDSLATAAAPDEPENKPKAETASPSAETNPATLLSGNGESDQNSTTELNDDGSATAAGFAPFRKWCNDRLSQDQRHVTLNYANLDHAVTEITPDGQVRIIHGENPRLIPFDQRYIPQILEQLL